MSDIQYTIRSVPKSVDSYLRQQARSRGRSLNSTILSYIEGGVSRDKSRHDDFSWLAGSNTIDEASLMVIEESKAYDKYKQHPQ